MQGRLVDCEKKNFVQYFPHKTWKKDLLFTSLLDFQYIEWTVNLKNIKQNPIYNNPKLLEKELKKNKIIISSVTFDYLMESPFFKNKKLKNFFAVFQKTLNNLDFLKIKYIVLPLLDSSSLENKDDEFVFTIEMRNFLKKYKGRVKILIESDFPPEKLKAFITNFKSKKIGINYDTGNSAYFNYNFNKEKEYFKFVKNIHLKDRLLFGKSVRLGSGNWNYKIFFKFLKKINYNGAMTLQTARSSTNEHIEEILINRFFIKNYIK